MPDTNKKPINKYAYYVAVAVFSSLFTFIINWRDQNRAGYRDLLDRYESTVVSLEKRVAGLEAENITLTARLEILSQSRLTAPIPAWIKGVDGRMITLNPAYEDLFLKPYGKTMRDYIGLTDEEFWGSLGLQEQAKAYWQNDMKVIRSGRVTRVEEDVIIKGTTITLIVYKYPYFSSSFGSTPSKVVGVAGLCVVK